MLLLLCQITKHTYSVSSSWNASIKNYPIQKLDLVELLGLHQKSSSSVTV